MKCMVCGAEAHPCAPLTFCEKCRNTKEAEAIRQRHREWFAEIVKERDKKK